MTSEGQSIRIMCAGGVSKRGVDGGPVLLHRVEGHGMGRTILARRKVPHWQSTSAKIARPMLAVEESFVSNAPRARLPRHARSEVPASGSKFRMEIGQGESKTIQLRIVFDSCRPLSLLLSQLPHRRNSRGNRSLRLRTRAFLIGHGACWTPKAGRMEKDWRR
jgi:hypothetical protein